MKRAASILWTAFLLFLYPSVSLAGFSGSLSYDYQDYKRDHPTIGEQWRENYLLQRYSLNYDKYIPLAEGSLGKIEGSVGLGWDFLDKDVNGENIKVDAFRNQYRLNAVFAPLKVPVYLELLSERTQSPTLNPVDFTSRFSKENEYLNNNVVWHNKVTFKYVVPRYFYLLIPSYNGNGNGNGSGSGNGNGNGLSFSGNGNGNGLAFGNGNGNGALFGNGNGNGNGGFFGNGNGGNGNGNGNGGGFALRRRVGPLVPYAYFFTWDNYKSEGDYATYKYNSYNLSLGFLKFWFTANYDERKDDFSDSQRTSVSIGQLIYDGRLIWTRVSNWVSASSYFTYENERSYGEKVLDRYQGNFLFNTKRKNWQSDLAGRITYEQMQPYDRLNVYLPYNFYGSSTPTSSYSGNLVYELDRYMYKDELSKAVNVNTMSHGYSYQFVKNGWRLTSSHDIVSKIDNVSNNSSDFTALDYRFNLYKPSDLTNLYTQEAGYQGTVVKNLEGSETLYQMHTLKYGLMGPIKEGMSFTLNDQVSYYDKGELPIISNENYISERRRVENDFEPTGRSIRNSLSFSLNHTVSSSLMLSAGASDDEIFYMGSDAHESRRMLSMSAAYAALERKLTMQGEFFYINTERMSSDSENTYRASLKIDYFPAYNIRSKTQLSSSREETEHVSLVNSKHTAWENSVSEELSYSFYIDDFGSRRILEARAYASGSRFSKPATEKIGIGSFAGYNSADPYSEKSLYSLEGSVSVYPHRYVTLTGYYRENIYKEEGFEAKKNNSFSLYAAVNFPKLSISANYTETKTRIEQNQNESRYYLRVTKTF